MNEDQYSAFLDEISEALYYRNHKFIQYQVEQLFYYWRLLFDITNGLNKEDFYKYNNLTSTDDITFIESKYNEWLIEEEMHPDVCLASDYILCDIQEGRPNLHENLIELKAYMKKWAEDVSEKGRKRNEERAKKNKKEES